MPNGTTAHTIYITGHEIQWWYSIYDICMAPCTCINGYKLWYKCTSPELNCFYPPLLENLSFSLQYIQSDALFNISHVQHNRQSPVLALITFNAKPDISLQCHEMEEYFLDSQVHGAHMGLIWGRQDPGGPHVGPINLGYLGYSCLSIQLDSLQHSIIWYQGHWIIWLHF